MLVVRYEVREALRTSVWVVTDVILQALLRSLLKKLCYLLCRKTRRVVTLMEDVRFLESVQLTPNELFLYSPSFDCLD